MVDLIDTPSPNHETRADGLAVDMLVVHYTGMTSARAALERLCDPEAKVSAHYLIDEDGAVHRLVAEDRRAWHAGVAAWRGETDVNGRSIGIELVNPGHEYGYRPFPDAQMDSFRELAAGILTRHSIPARNVVGHSDVAPTRKSDPGEFFDWRGLAAIGIGLWTEPAEMLDLDPAHLRALLADIGYDTEDLPATVRAFQRHYRPERANGRIDPETARLIAGLHALACGPSQHGV